MTFPFDDPSVREDDFANSDHGKVSVFSLVRVERDEKTPAEKCSWCDRGTWTDSNNQRRRCAYCVGTGAAPKPTTPRTA